MSDLLPLVAAALNDRAALDAKKEIDELREKLSAVYAVEVIRKSRNEDRGGPSNENDDGGDDVVVYSSAPFQSGRYGSNPLYWQVDLQQSESHVCRLGDVEECLICVGGGFPLADLSRDRWFQGYLDVTYDDDESHNYKSPMITICFANTPIWIDFLVQGWPREAWEAKIQADDLNPDDCIAYLVDEVAEQYPEATIRVTNVSFNSVHMHAAMKRLLPPRLREEAQAEVDGRATTRSDEEEALISFACTTLRNTNPSAGSLYGIYSRDILNGLRRIGINERNKANDELVTGLVHVRVAGGLSGRDNFDGLVDRLVESRGGRDE